MKPCLSERVSIICLTLVEFVEETLAFSFQLVCLLDEFYSVFNL
jgi:hypothetical protein